MSTTVETAPAARPSVFDVLLRASRRYHVRMWGRINAQGVFDGNRDWDSPPESFFHSMEEAYDECARMNLKEVLRTLSFESERISSALSRILMDRKSTCGLTVIQLSALAILQEAEVQETKT